MPGIRQLLEVPFGPYPEEILSEKGRVTTLKSLYLECGGLPIGFDKTEYIATPPRTSRIVRHATEFYGILDIVSLELLSPRGRKWLEQDLLQRDRQLNPQFSQHGLTLSSLYRESEGPRLCVMIQGIKRMSAQFLTSDKYPLSLIIHSMEDRRYNVLSLDVGMCKTSQNFLARYRLWALIDEIIKTDPAQTPIEKRTIAWLVHNYFTRFRHLGVLNEAEGMRSRRRFLRHIPRAELIGIFAAHADWLLAQQLASNSNAVKKVNIKKWISFCSQVAVARRQASRENISWGLPYGGTIDEDIFDLSRFGQTKEFWSNKIKNALKKPKPKPKLVPRMPSPLINMPLANKRHQPEFHYDSDFSEASTSAYSDSTDADEDVIFDGLSIPVFLSQPPTIPAGRFEWRCPGCNYTIDFLDLSNDNMKILSLADARRLQGRLWKSLRDEYVQTAFFAMVNDHYTTVHHNPPQLHSVPQQKTHKMPGVKTEEWDVIIPGGNRARWG